MNKTTLTLTATVFAQLMRRDVYVYGKQWKQLLINNVLIYPIIYSIAFAYLQSRAYFGNNAESMGTLVFAGNIIIPLMNNAFFIAFDLFFDLLHSRHITYQITVLNPRLVLLQRLLTTWLFCFILSAPFYPIAKLILGNKLNTTHTQWALVMIIIAAGSFCCASYHLLAACIIKRPYQINTFWARINIPMFTFGGFFIPRYIIESFSPILGALLYLNPAVYITDGLRQALVGGPHFLPIWLCTGVLIITGCICFFITCYCFKKQIDHI